MKVGDRVRLIKSSNDITGGIIKVDCPYFEVRFSDGKSYYYKEAELESIEPALTLEPGKFYRTRHGRKVRIYAVDGGGDFNDAHGAILNEHDVWDVSTWDKAGNYNSIDGYSPKDIISEWSDRPIVNWKAMPEWARAVANTKSGLWLWFFDVPRADKWGWHDEDGGGGFFIPPAYHPTDSEGKPWAGNWEDSLCERPEGE